MTSVEAVELLKEEMANGNEEVISFVEEILEKKFFRNFMKYPKAATRKEKERCKNI